MKIRIDCVNINVPRETTKTAFDEPNPIRTNKQREEIAKLRSRIMELKQQLSDVAGAEGHVLTSYHNEIVNEWKKQDVNTRAKLTRTQEALRELTEEHVEWGDKNDRLEARRSELNLANVSLKAENDGLEARRKELQVANTELGAKLIEDAKDHNNLRDSHQEILLINERLRKTEKTQNERMLVIVEQRDEAWSKVKILEDKVAGYELGMSKEQVAKECDKKQRKHAKRLTKEEVWKIRRLHKAKHKGTWIAEFMGIKSPSVVTKIIRGECYANIPEEVIKPTKVRAGHGVVK